MAAAFAISLVLSVISPAATEDQLYQVVGTYETNQAGQVLRQQNMSGWLKLLGNGTYQLQVHVYDEGSYQVVQASAVNPRDVIWFASKKGYRFFSYPGDKGDNQDICLYRTAGLTDAWVRAARTKALLPAPSPPPAPPAATAGGGSGFSVVNGVFTSVVMYGTTSAPSYYQYDPATGRYSHDRKGIIFHPNGTYYLNAAFGGMTGEERGRYQVAGNQVKIQFSDGSTLALTVMDDGRKLHWYSSGMLIGEFFFLGVAK